MGVNVPYSYPLLMHACTCTVADDSDEESAVVRKEKRVAWGKVIQKTSTKSHEKASGSLSSFFFPGRCAVQFWCYFHCTAGGQSDSDGESDEANRSKVTLAYQSKRTAEREGLHDMGATLTLETESTTKKVI